MSAEVRTLDQNIVASLVINGDLKRLTPQQKVEYYNYRCQQVGLDPSAKPFDLLTLNGKEVLYANAACTQQLASIHKLSPKITGRELTEGIYCVFCQVTGADGRCTENMGAVPLDGLKGDARANAMMKATTKAIRRTILVHMGLGMMDETEAETIEPDPGIEWTQEELDGATAYLNDFAEALAERGLDKPEIEQILDKPKSTKGLSDVSFNTWVNRLMGYSERQLKKLEA